MGLTGRTLEPYGHIRTDGLCDIFREHIGALLEGGVDFLVLETFGDLPAIEQAVGAVVELTELPTVAQMTFPQDLRTPRGR